MSRIDPERELRAALNDLSRSPLDGPAPDLSRSIMGRLGYMRVGAEVARRRRMRTWASRAGMFAVAGLAFAIGLRVFVDSPQVRRPSETTLPQAIRHDVEQQQERLGSMLQTIRTISGPKIGPQNGSKDASPVDGGRRAGRPTPIAQPAPGSIDSPFTAEDQLTPDQRGNQPVVPSPNQAPNGQEMREDLNRTTRSPVRWV